MHFVSDKSYVTMHKNNPDKTFPLYFCTLNYFFCAVFHAVALKMQTMTIIPWWRQLKKRKINETVEENKLFKIYLNGFSVC